MVAMTQAARPSTSREKPRTRPTTPDSAVPPVATLAQEALGAHRAACFDLNIGCSAFVHALTVARALLEMRPGAHALVVGADTWSRFTDPRDRSTAVLLGDAAGAVVLGPYAGQMLGDLGAEVVKVEPLEGDVARYAHPGGRRHFHLQLSVFRC